MKSVEILIPNYHCLKAIELAVESVRAFTSPGTYSLVVHDDGIPKNLEKLEGFTYRNRHYLRKCAEKGWLRLIEAKENLGHGTSLDILIKQCTANIAVILDCDTQILKYGWLGEAVSLFVDERDLLFCNLEEIKTRLPSLSPWLNPWFAVLNMEAYRKDMEIDWGTVRVDGVWWNVGARLLMKLRDDNPEGYRIQPIPGKLQDYYYHHVHASCTSVVCPHDTPSYVATHNRRFTKIREELANLRKR